MDVCSSFSSHCRTAHLPDLFLMPWRASCPSLLALSSSSHIPPARCGRRGHRPDAAASPFALGHSVEVNAASLEHRLHRPLAIRCGWLPAASKISTSFRLLLVAQAQPPDTRALLFLRPQAEVSQKRGPSTHPAKRIVLIPGAQWPLDSCISVATCAYAISQ